MDEEQKILINKIKESLKKCEPFLEKDGGGIDLADVDFENKIIEVSFKGNCINCPLSIMTLRAGVERLLLMDFPDFKRVELAR